MNNNVVKFMEEKLNKYKILELKIKDIDDMLNHKHNFVLTNYRTKTVDPFGLGFEDKIIELMIEAKEKLKRELEEL